jgi:uncharacterized protein
MNSPEKGGLSSLISNYWTYGLLGIYFGFVLTRSEALSWFRIQEMFRFQSFHMYGMIGSAIVTAAISVWVIRKWEIKTLTGEDIVLPPKDMGSGTRYWMGGTIFGFGWAMTGACPGPMIALAGNGVSVIFLSIIAAVLGTWTYGVLRPRLPH